jgi:hypothetical protein
MAPPDLKKLTSNPIVARLLDLAKAWARDNPTIVVNATTNVMSKVVGKLPGKLGGFAQGVVAAAGTQTLKNLVTPVANPKVAVLTPTKKVSAVQAAVDRAKH